MPELKFTKTYTGSYRSYRFEHDGQTYEVFRFRSKLLGWCVDRVDGDKLTRVVSAEDTRKAAVAQIVGEQDAGKPTERTPYDTEHVQIIHEPGLVTALYIPDPEMARNPRAVLDARASDWRKYEDVEVVAEATRFYQTEGATFSGWVVRSGLDYTDPIPNKRDAMEQMRYVIDEHFAH